jgi:hypothetical protein
MLELTFKNNEIKIFDVKPYLDTGVFKTLQDKIFFNLVKVAFNSIEWPNGIDLDPEVLYEKSIIKRKCLNKSKRHITNAKSTLPEGG